VVLKLIVLIILFYCMMAGYLDCNYPSISRKNLNDALYSTLVCSPFLWQRGTHGAVLVWLVCMLTKKSTHIKFVQETLYSGRL
jgi:hypothetical protein